MQKKDGIERLTTETGAGQWGTALSLACSQVDLDCTVYMVKVSFDQKPFRKVIMGIYGGKFMLLQVNIQKLEEKL